MNGFRRRYTNVVWFDLESYRDEVLTKNLRNFALLAEGPLEQLQQLQEQIDDYLQHVQATAMAARP